MSSTGVYPTSKVPTTTASTMHSPYRLRKKRPITATPLDSHQNDATKKVRSVSNQSFSVSEMQSGASQQVQKEQNKEDKVLSQQHKIILSQALNLLKKSQNSAATIQLCNVYTHSLEKNLQEISEIKELAEQQNTARAIEIEDNQLNLRIYKKYLEVFPNCDETKRELESLEIYLKTESFVSKAKKMFQQGKFENAIAEFEKLLNNPLREEDRLIVVSFKNVAEEIVKIGKEFEKNQDIELIKKAWDIYLKHFPNNEIAKKQFEKVNAAREALKAAENACDQVPSDVITLIEDLKKYSDFPIKLKDQVLHKSKKTFKDFFAPLYRP
jgi:tetratricopeptide (TPR) repeat protein